MRHTRKVCVVLLLLNKTCCSANVNKVNIIILWIFKLTFYNVSFYEEQIKDIFHLIQAIKQTQNQQKLSISKLFILRHNTCRTGIFPVSLILSICKIINVFMIGSFMERAVVVLRTYNIYEFGFQKLLKKDKLQRYTLC